MGAMDDDVPVEKCEEVLAELFNCVDKPVEAAEQTERYGDWLEFLVPIGKNHCAYVTVARDSYNWLYERLLKKVRNKYGRSKSES